MKRGDTEVVQGSERKPGIPPTIIESHRKKEDVVVETNKEDRKRRGGETMKSKARREKEAEQRMSPIPQTKAAREC